MPTYDRLFNDTDGHDTSKIAGALNAMQRDIDGGRGYPDYADKIGEAFLASDPVTFTDRAACIFDDFMGDARTPPVGQLIIAKAMTVMFSATGYEPDDLPEFSRRLDDGAANDNDYQDVDDVLDSLDVSEDDVSEDAYDPRDDELSESDGRR